MVEHATDAVGDELLDPGRSRGTNNRVARKMEYLIPCCRALKHVAMASDGQLSWFMDYLLLAKTPTTKSDNPAVENGIRPLKCPLRNLYHSGRWGRVIPFPILHLRLRRWHEVACTMPEYNPILLPLRHVVHCYQPCAMRLFLHCRNLTFNGR